ncbi:uncharacterized protein FFB14_15855 [Fusarium fujikuroi]|nr:uncharacterized protein FFB14_15855 [Fusarium fujikuroi]
MTETARRKPTTV